MPHNVSYSEKFDKAFCKGCDIWLEKGKCEDIECFFCGPDFENERPSSMGNLKERDDVETGYMCPNDIQGT